VKWKQTARVVAGFALVSALLFRPDAATATFRGENGMLAVEIESGPFSDQIVILNPDGSFSHFFPSREDVAHLDPSWSPDGQLIAFSYDFHVAVARPDGSGLTKLTNGLDERRPRWSPDQTRIMYQSLEVSYNNEIFVMDSDGGGQTNLTRNPAQDTDGEWAPNGGKMAFLSDRKFTAAGGDGLFVMNPDGSEVVGMASLRTSCDPGRFFASWKPPYSWSPDGLRIAFSSCLRGQREVFSAAVGARERRNLTDNPADDAEPVWGPDGRIAFASNRDNNSRICDRDCNYELYVMDADGSHVTRLTNDPDATVPLQWSPDGTKILFARFDNVGVDTLFVMDADGSNVFPLDTGDAFNYATDWQPVPPG
jgi:Tol biopolymer transport system component